MKRFLFLGLVAALAATFAAAQQSTVTIPVTRTRANDGKQMFNNYCAPCHGVDGRGRGLNAAALKEAPADLSVLSRNNNGVYPASHVLAVMHFGTENAAPASKEMPIWAPVLGKIDHSMGSDDMQALRINNLVRYLETLQVR